MNARWVVEEARRLMQEDVYDQVWCVFDRDSFPPAHFNGALQLASRSGIRVAYSNEAFEIWYLLHFHYHDSATSRDLYAELLTQRFGYPYRKNDPDIYDALEPFQEAALRNAQRLLSSYPIPRPVDDNPSTTVHELVEQLRRFAV